MNPIKDCSAIKASTVVLASDFQSDSPLNPLYKAFPAILLRTPVHAGMRVQVVGSVARCWGVGLNPPALGRAPPSLRAAISREKNPRLPIGHRGER